MMYNHQKSTRPNKWRWNPELFSRRSSTISKCTRQMKSWTSSSKIWVMNSSTSHRTYRVGTSWRRISPGSSNAKSRIVSLRCAKDSCKSLPHLTQGRMARILKFSDWSSCLASAIIKATTSQSLDILLRTISWRIKMRDPWNQMWKVRKCWAS